MTREHNPRPTDPRLRLSPCPLGARLLRVAPASRAPLSRNTACDSAAFWFARAASHTHSNRRTVFRRCKLTEERTPKTTVPVAPLAGDTTVPPPVARAVKRDTVATSSVGQTAQSEGTSPAPHATPHGEVARSSPPLNVPEHPWSPTRRRELGWRLPARRQVNRDPYLPATPRRGTGSWESECLPPLDTRRAVIAHHVSRPQSPSPHAASHFRVMALQWRERVPL